MGDRACVHLEEEEDNMVGVQVVGGAGGPLGSLGHCGILRLHKLEH